MLTALSIAAAVMLLLGVGKIPTPTISRATQSTYVDEIDWMRGFIDALRSGATAREALSYTNLDLVPTAKAVLQQQGELSAALATDAIKRNSLLLKALAACWQVSQQHGAPLSPAMQSALTAQLDRIAIAEEIRSQLAGPKTAALTLALLPVATLLMAQLIGIPAFAWLIGSAVGLGVLIVGASLLIAGSWVMHKLASNIERELQL
jgi:Flp pilus assembly protein TadB